MKTPEEINKEGYPYTYIQTDERGVAQYSVNPVIIQGQKLFSASLSKGEYEVQTREGYKIMAYRSQMGYINAVALPDNIYHKKSNQWRMKMTLIIVVTFLILYFPYYHIHPFSTISCHSSPPQVESAIPRSCNPNFLYISTFCSKHVRNSFFRPFAFSRRL